MNPLHSLVKRPPSGANASGTSEVLCPSSSDQSWARGLPNVDGLDHRYCLDKRGLVSHVLFSSFDRQVRCAVANSMQCTRSRITSLPPFAVGFPQPLRFGQVFSQVASNLKLAGDVDPTRELQLTSNIC